MINEEVKERTFNRLVKAIKEKKSQDVIEEIIEIGDLSKEDFEKAMKFAKEIKQG